MQDTGIQYGKEYTHWQPQEVETLVHELQLWLARHADLIDDDNICRELQVLARWSDYYHRGLVTADAYIETSAIVLTGLCDRMKLAFEELHRFEGEGGPVASKEQAAEHETMLKAIHRIERILSRTSMTTH